MLFGYTGEHAIEPIFNIGNGHSTHTPGQRGNSFAQVFNDLQSDLGVLQYQLFKLATAETTGKALLKAIGSDRVVIPLFEIF